MPDKNRNQIGDGPEFEVAYYTKELGKSLQRQMLQKQISQLGDDRNKAVASVNGGSDGEDAARPTIDPPVAEDHAG